MVLKTGRSALHFTHRSESLDLPLLLHSLSALTVISTLRRQHATGGKQIPPGFSFNIFVPRDGICAAFLVSVSDQLL